MSHLFNVLKTGALWTLSPFKIVLGFVFQKKALTFTMFTIIYTFFTTLITGINSGNWTPFVNEFFLRVALIDNYFYEFTYGIVYNGSNFITRLWDFLTYYGDLILNLWWYVMLGWLIYKVIKYTPIFQIPFNAVGFSIDESQNGKIFVITTILIIFIQMIGGLFMTFEDDVNITGDSSQSRMMTFFHNVNPFKGFVELFKNIPVIINDFNNVFTSQEVVE